MRATIGRLRELAQHYERSAAAIRETLSLLDGDATKRAKRNGRATIAAAVRVRRAAKKPAESLVHPASGLKVSDAVLGALRAAGRPLTPQEVFERVSAMRVQTRSRDVRSMVVVTLANLRKRGRVSGPVKNRWIVKAG